VTTALTVGNSEGIVGRCDAKCHTAHEVDCDCVCGGRLHGCGSSQLAIERNTVDWFGSLEAAQAWAQAHGVENPIIERPLL
jgi:hypothetical protein